MKTKASVSFFARAAAVLLLLALMTTATAWAETVTLTAETGAVTLNDGDVLTGTGGVSTAVTVADGATVTLRGVTIIADTEDYNNYHPGITCAGNATIILADGTTNSIQGGSQRAGIFVPSSKSLTISGSGSLTVTGGYKGAGIGSNYFASDCGSIYITGGTVTAIGGEAAAGIGCTTQSTCENITISGGTVTARGGYDAAGIGCAGILSECKGITITKDVVSLTATGGSYKANAIGWGPDKSSSILGHVTIGGTEVTNVPQKQFVYCPAETSTHYTVHFDKNNANVSGTMTDQVFTSNTPEALTSCGFIYDDYHYFDGWNTAADGTGYNVINGQAVINLGDITLYAQWKATDYSITYVNAKDGTDCVTNKNPTSYTVESNDIILADPVRVGFTFDGWTYEGQDEPTKTVTIPQGSYGDKTFTAHWTFSPTATITTSTRDAFIYDGQTLTGTGGKDTHVTIAAGATVTLSDVTINSIENSSDHQWTGITCEGDATIILNGENTVKGGYHCSGIFVPKDKTLVIRGNGSLNATGVGSAAGIGSVYRGSCGNIIIDGGTITATGDSGGAGIGSGRGGHCGNITITRGVTSVTATKGEGGLNSVGAGGSGTCGMVVIGGVQGAITESPYTYTPTGSNNSTVYFDANGGTGTMADWLFTYDGTWQSLPANTFTAPDGYVLTEWNTKADGSGVSYRDEQQILDIANMMTLYAQWTSITYTLTTETGAVILFNGQTLTGTGGKETRVTIADGATVTLSGATITKIKTTSSDYQWAGITCEGDATIILNGENTVKGGYHCSGIFVPKDKTLVIRGNGSLNATGVGSAAGIGSVYRGSCGNIIISGGTVTATGGSRGAGIGSGRFGSCGNITITEGITRVTATASDEADMIGRGSGTSSTCGTITISPTLLDETVDYTRKLWPGMVLADNADNSTAISNKDGLTTDAQLKGRTLWKDGDWNTLCLPFNVDLSAADCPLAETGLTVMALDDSNSSLAQGTLTLNFVPANTIEAGKPYIIKWNEDTSNPTITNPVFNDVTINNTISTEVTFTGGSFVGTYAPITFDSENKSILFLGAENTLYYPLANARIGAFRSYFQLTDPSTPVKSFVLNFDETDAIESLSPDPSPVREGSAGAWYDLQGRKVNKPAQRGIYVNNGKKVVVK